MNEIAAPQTYRSIATVTLSELPTTGPLTSAVAQQVANYQAAATSVGVLDTAAEASGVSRADVSISTRRVGQGAIVLVVGTGGDSEDTKDFVEAVSRAALAAPLSLDVAILKEQSETQQALADRAVDRFEDESDARGIGLSENIVELYSRRFRDARDQLGAAQAAGEDTTAEEAEVNRLAGVLADLRALAALDSQANAQLNALGTIQENLALAEGELASTESRDLGLTDPEQLGRITPALRSALAAAVFGLLIALGIVAFLEVGTKRRRQRRDTRTRVMEKQRRTAVSESASARS